MKFLRHFLCFLCTTIWFVCIVAARRRPEINPKGPDILLKSGDTLKLICSGGNNLRWSIPSHLDEDYSRVKEENGNEELVLEVTDLKYTDTGRFRCSYQNHDPNVVEEESAVYVYVSELSENTLILPPPDGGFLHFRQHQQGIIPCRVTNPKAQVTLDYVDVDAFGITYDPRRGFIVPDPSLRLEDFMVCTANLDGFSQEAMFIIRVSIEEILIPHIDVTPEDLINVGASNLTLTCSVNTETRVSMHMQWDGYPQQRNVYIDKQRINKKKGMYEYILKMTIKNVTAANEGSYTCKVQDTLTLQTKYANKTLIILEEFPYINHFQKELEIAVTSVNWFWYEVFKLTI